MSYVIGIDASSARLGAGLVDSHTGVVLRRLHSDRPTTNVAVLRACAELAEQLQGSHEISQIGIAVPEIVSPLGHIESASKWDWRSLDIAAALAHIAPAQVHSDVRAAALGEARFGAGRGLECFVFLTIDEGISAAIVRHGVPWLGRCGAALVLGVPPVEDVAGERALSLAIGPHNVLDSLNNPENRVHVVKAARMLGRELGRVVNLIDPDAIIVGGGLGLNADYRERWVGVMRESVWHRPSSLVPVVAAQLGHDAGIIGAAIAPSPYAAIVD